MNDLHDLLTDAVADVDPEHRLAAIHARTSARRRSHRRWYAGGAVLVAAAAVVVVANVAATGHHPDSGPATNGPITPPTAPPSTPARVAPSEQEQVPIFYQGATPSGRRLFVEDVQVVRGAGEDDAVLQALMAKPNDPDYSTAWPAGSLANVEQQGDIVYVTLGPGAPAHDLLALQQLAYTLAGVGHGTVIIEQPGLPPDENLRPLTKAPTTTVLAPVAIESPGDGARVARHSTARGLTTTFEGGLTWQVVNAQGKRLAGGPVSADGSSWTADVDLSRVPAGEYMFEVSTGVSASGKDGVPPSTDTREIIVK